MSEILLIKAAENELKKYKWKRLKKQSETRWNNFRENLIKSHETSFKTIII